MSILTFTESFNSYLKTMLMKKHWGEKRAVRVFLAGLAALLFTGCSIRQAAVNLIGDALAGGGGVYTSDDDPELIREAIPFGLKTYEGLLAVSPEHRGLLLAAAKGFTSYAYLLQDEAERIDASRLAEARRLRRRAYKLYLRGRDYALQGLEVEHTDFTALLKSDSASALAMTTEDDVQFLYWAGISWAGALTAAKDNLDLIAELPFAAVLLRRVLEHDESYELGAAHEFFISYEGGRPGGNSRLAREHYRRSLEISGGSRASVHLALAEAVAIREQNLTEFRALIAAALAVDPDNTPALRLRNVIARRRARWLESQIPNLFLDADGREENK
ncbi:MAG: TRAP transporter TatT component family protein [Candidatus Binatia bacterium]